MPTEMELTLEQTQQGVSYEVSNIRVNSFTMKMEILLEPTSNKLMVGRSSWIRRIRKDGGEGTDSSDSKNHSTCLLVGEYLQKERILELKRRYFEDYYSNNQYAISIKEDTVVFVPALTKDHKGNKFNTPYPEDQYAVLEI
ncbi:hypothetical protein Tco_0968718 [Tanacetum coccineum]